MDAKKIVAANLRRLMQYAADHQTGEPASGKALARATKLGRGTIHRALSGDETAVAVDTLELLAAAYNLSAWQVLIPGLDPSNPPVIPVTDTEKLLQERLREVSREFLRHLDAEAAGHHPGPSPDRTGEAQGAGVHPDKPKPKPKPKPASARSR